MFRKKLQKSEIKQIGKNTMIRRNILNHNKKNTAEQHYEQIMFPKRILQSSIMNGKCFEN